MEQDRVCPLTQQLFVDPVVAGDGNTYERAAIQQWFDTGHDTSPVTGQPLPNLQLVPSMSMRRGRGWLPAPQVPELLAAARTAAVVFGEESEVARLATAAQTVSEVFAAFSRAPPAPITPHQADLLISGVFLPLTDRATSPEEMSAMFNAISTIVAPGAPGNLQDTFATPQVRDGLFLSSPHSTSGDATEQMFRAMYNITCGDDAGAVRRRNAFATPAVRDGVFLTARATAAVSHDTAEWMFRAMNNLAEGADEDASRRRNVFATETVRDEIFIPFAQHAVYAGDAEAAPANLFRAISNIVAGDDSGAGSRRDLFATVAMRDAVFLPLAEQSANGAPIGDLVHAVEAITGGADPHAADRCNVFATATVRDRLFVPLAARAAADPAASESLLRAIANITGGTDAAVGSRRNVFASRSVRDNVFGLLARRTRATPRLCVEALEAITRGTDAAAQQRRAIFTPGSPDQQSETTAPPTSDTRGSYSSYDECLNAWGFTDQHGGLGSQPPTVSESSGRDTYLVQRAEREGRIPEWDESPAMRGLRHTSDVPTGEPEAEPARAEFAEFAEEPEAAPFDGLDPSWLEGSLVSFSDESTARSDRGY